VKIIGEFIGLSKFELPTRPGIGYIKKFFGSVCDPDQSDKKII